MPKLKTKSGAKKRFKVTGTGKVLYAQRGKRHGMIKRTKKQIRSSAAPACCSRPTATTSRSISCRTPDRVPVHFAEPRSRGDPSPFHMKESVMSRVKRGVTSHAKHKKVYKAAKGFYGRRKNTIRAAKAAVDKVGQYAFRDRKRKKRTFRALWIQRLNAAVRAFGMTYSRVHQRPCPSRASRSTARCCRISPSTSRRRSRRSPKRPRPRWRRKPSPLAAALKSSLAGLIAAEAQLALCPGHRTS